MFPLGMPDYEESISSGYNDENETARYYSRLSGTSILAWRGDLGENPSIFGDDPDESVVPLGRRPCRIDREGRHHSAALGQGLLRRGLLGCWHGASNKGRQGDGGKAGCRQDRRRRNIWWTRSGSN